MPRFVTDSRPISAQQPITEFYRQEFAKHHRCLQQHRPYFSESAITDVEAALARIMVKLLLGGIVLPYARVFVSIFLISLYSLEIRSVPRQFTSGVDLVEVYATVSDARGEPVAGLTKDDFIVEEDGRRQDIRTFSAGEFPLALAVGIDRSFSMGQPVSVQITIELTFTLR